MTELTDLEICKRIVEIEGIPCYISENKKHVMVEDKSTPTTRWIRSTEYNPLTDKALCFDLMVKYEAFIKKARMQKNGKYIANIFNECFTKYSDDPQRAICLAIIEKHNDN